MKKLAIVLCALFVVFATSCTKDGNAEAFVGTYKVSSNRVRTSGYFSTEGEVVGNSVYFESMYAQDAAGYTTTVFGTGNLNGNVLTFTCNMSGQLASNGIMYPFYSTAQMTCIKQ